MASDHKKVTRVRSSLAQFSGKMKQPLMNLSLINTLLFEWLLEVSAFVLLPLIIYIVTFLSLSRPVVEVFKSPEVMFIAIILYGEALKRLVLFYRGYRGFPLKITRALSCGILGITVSSVLLCFSLITEKKELLMSDTYYVIKGVVFLCALGLSAFAKVLSGMSEGEAELYGTLQKEKKRTSGEHHFMGN